MNALIKRFEYEQRRIEFMSAQVAASVVNFSIGRPKHPVRPQDFMPSEFRRSAAKPKRLTRKRREAIAEGVSKSMGMLMARRNG